MHRPNLRRALALSVVPMVLAAPALAGTVRIGVLAKDGPVKAVQEWKATGEYLAAQIDGTTFEIVPLAFDAVYPAIETGKVEYFIANSSMFVTAEEKYGAKAVATMVNTRQGKPLSAFGGVIISAPGSGITKLTDLRGHTFMAVDASSFGGWQMALKEMRDAGIDPDRDLSKLQFGKKHENVVMAVINGVVDAGTVRTDTLEQMAADGLIQLTDVQIVNEQKHAGFPFVCSTALYPEWPLAATKSATAATTTAIVEALQKMKPEDAAAKAAGVAGWSAVLDYTPVSELQATLGL